jgi:hypothetical protein
VEAYKEEFNQAAHDEEENPHEPAPLFPVRAVVEAKYPAHCRSVLKFSLDEFLQLYEIAELLLRPKGRECHPKTDPIDKSFVFL